MSEPIPVIDKQWYYEKSGIRHGAVSETELVALISSGQLTSATTVWSAGMSGWMSAEKAGLLPPPRTDLPPPLAGNQVNNVLVWVLAFAPLISFFMEYIIALIEYDNELLATLAVRNMNYFYIPIAMNVLLTLLDERKLRLAGHDTTQFKGWIWLVPVYLYQRAERLGQPKYYFATWILCFLASLAR